MNTKGFPPRGVFSLIPVLLASHGAKRSGRKRSCGRSALDDNAWPARAGPGDRTPVSCRKAGRSTPSREARSARRPTAGRTTTTTSPAPITTSSRATACTTRWVWWTSMKSWPSGPSPPATRNSAFTSTSRPTLKPTDLLAVTFDANNFETEGYADPRRGVSVYFNGVLVQPQIVIRPPQLDVDYTTPAFTLASVNAVVGPDHDNIVTLRGTDYNADGGGTVDGHRLCPAHQGNHRDSSAGVPLVGRQRRQWLARRGRRRSQHDVC